MSSTVSGSRPDPPEPGPWALSRGQWHEPLLCAFSLELDGGLDAPAIARRRLVAELRDLLEESQVAELELLVSELVTNCVRHGGMRTRNDRIAVHGAMTHERIRIEVCDTGPGFEQEGVPRPRSFERGGGGLGLVLLDRISLAWGVAVEETTCVWAEFVRRRPDP